MLYACYFNSLWVSGFVCLSGCCETICVLFDGLLLGCVYVIGPKGVVLGY